ncbi:hypothetical protein PsYK624_121640 [Phanerochaete sordida]|uniref:DUF6533 domain-containing protein n=1 Tax=Phanerochaete sordida TaxID=48140 RepID=A0A9P3GJK4_9APHY|nr:hypothetical protein PsYK624_121640 [Phanerochaete sordida]
MSSSESLSTIFTNFQYNRVTNYLDVISSVLTIYDWLLTLAREVELVWRSPWSAIKVLFLVTRYTPRTLAPTVVAQRSPRTTSPRARAMLTTSGRGGRTSPGSSSPR